MPHKSTGETLKGRFVRTWFLWWTCSRHFGRPQCFAGGQLYRVAIWWIVLVVCIQCAGAGLDGPCDEPTLLTRCASLPGGEGRFT
jgi:hypothetical protein